MRVAVVSHACVIEANRGKLRALARRGDLELLAIAPSRWVNHDVGQVLRYEPSATDALRVEPVPAWAPGHPALLGYAPWSLSARVRRFRPHLIHLEEEPWTVAAAEVAALAGILRTRLVFFTWQNVAARLPLPGRIGRSLVLRAAHGAVAGSREAAQLLERKGFRKPLAVIPQLGIDPVRFTPAARPPDQFVIGYVGRLVREKGVLLLLEAAARVRDARVVIVGAGPLHAELLSRARALGLANQLALTGLVSHHRIPEHVRGMSVLVLPSLSTPRWTEQFGHVLIEAMACGVPVIGSDSGAIPEVIGDAGIVVPEGDVAALAAALARLRTDTALQEQLRARGRTRALTHYSDQQLADRLAAFWASL